MKLTKNIATLAIAASIGAFSLSPAHAQGVPTVDSRAIIQQIEIVRQQAEDLGIQTEQLEKLLEQIRILEEQYAKLQEIENLLKNPSEILDMALGGELDGLLKGKFDASVVEVLAKGVKGDWSGIASGAGGERLRGAINSALSSAGTSQEKVTELASSDNPVKRNNATQTTANATMSAAAEVSYQEANHLTQRAQILVGEIPGLKSLKESVDHNSRITAELAIALAAMWQLEAVQTVSVGTMGVADAATLAEVEKFLTPAVE